MQFASFRRSQVSRMLERWGTWHFSSSAILCDGCQINSWVNYYFLSALSVPIPLILLNTMLLMIAHYLQVVCYCWQFNVSRQNNVSIVTQSSIITFLYWGSQSLLITGPGKDRATERWCVLTCVLQEKQQRGRLLKRISFVLMSGEANQYSSYLPEITGMWLIFKHCYCKCLVIIFCLFHCSREATG